MVFILGRIDTGRESVFVIMWHPNGQPLLSGESGLFKG